jgi:hypothetical protein
MVRLLVFNGTATGDENFLRFMKIKTKFFCAVVVGI